QREYTSAVSTKSPPAVANASSTANEVGSSQVQPRTLPPKQIEDTSMPVEPSRRLSMARFCHKMRPISDDRPRIRSAQAHAALRRSRQGRREDGPLRRVEHAG